MASLPLLPSYRPAPADAEQNPPNDWCSHDDPSRQIETARAGMRHSQCMQCGQTWVRPA